MHSKSLVVVLLVAGAVATGCKEIVALGQDPNVPQGSTTVTEVQREKGDRPEFPNEPSWTWLMRPRELSIGRKWGQAGEDGMMLTGYPIIDAEGGALRIVFSQAGPSSLDGPAYRLVVFDKAGARHLPNRGESGGFKSRGTYLLTAIFTLDPKVLAPGEAAYIGVERMTRAAP